MALPALSIKRPLSMVMPLGVGLAGFIAADKIPQMVNITSPLPRIGVKAAVAFGGGMVISRFLGKQSGALFTIGCGINLLQDILNTYVFKKAIAATAGYGAFPYQEYGAFPDEFRGYPTGETYPY